MIFHWPRFAMERKCLNQTLGTNVSPELVMKMLRSKAHGFLRNCKNIERAGEGRKEEESLKGEDRECLKANPPREVTAKL